MENTQVENTEDVVIEDINEETLLSLDETLELDQEQTEIAEGKCKKEGEDMEGEESDEDEKEDDEECEDEMNEGSLDSMTLEQLWDKHEENSYYADQGYGHGKGSIKNGKAAADAIFKFVKSKFGAKVADDMEDASQAYVSWAEYDGTSESKNKRKAIRKKHGLSTGIVEAKKMNEAKKMTEAEVNSDEEFTEYAKGILKAAHGDKYDEAKAMATIEGILKKADGDYGAAIGMITSGLGEEEMEDEEGMMEAILAEAGAGDTLDGFASEQEIIAALLKLPGVKDHLRKIKAKPYFDDNDFVVASKTAIRDALFNPDIKLADLAKAVMAEKGDFAKPEKEAMPNRVIVSADNEAAANKLLDLIKANNAKASSKDMKVKVQKFARKDGFKLYITGNSVSAIGPYKKFVKESDLYEDITHEEDMNEEIIEEIIEETIEENTISIDTSDITRLVESEEGLTEEFKEKASIIFEAAVKSKIKETEEALKESYAVALIEEVETIKSELVEKIDNYLTYAVESWVEDNKVAIEGGLRTQIAENFIQSLKTVFVENYIEVPESKQDLVAEMESSIAQLQNESAELENTVLALNEKVNSLTREKVISESTSDLADTQAEKLKSLLEDIECTSETSFRKKVATIKEFYLNGAALEEKSTLTEETESSDNSSYVTTETIVENETEVEVSPAMKNYLTALSRLSKATTANVPVVG